MTTTNKNVSALPITKEQIEKLAQFLERDEIFFKGLMETFTKDLLGKIPHFTLKDGTVPASLDEESKNTVKDGMFVFMFGVGAAGCILRKCRFTEKEIKDFVKETFGQDM